MGAEFIETYAEPLRTREGNDDDVADVDDELLGLVGVSGFSSLFA